MTDSPEPEFVEAPITKRKREAEDEVPDDSNGQTVKKQRKVGDGSEANAIEID